MGAMGMSQQDMLKVQLAQARGERATLEGRVKTTSQSIETLETALKQATETAPKDDPEVNYFAPENPTLILVIALIRTNLTQLKANLEEGMARIEYLDKSIKVMESQQSGVITNPGNFALRRPGRS